MPELLEVDRRCRVVARARGDVAGCVRTEGHFHGARSSLEEGGPERPRPLPLGRRY